MAHGIDAASAAAPPPADIPRDGLSGRLQRGVTALNSVCAVLSSLAIAAAGLILTWEVIGRHILPPGIERLRRMMADSVACVFCAYFAVKSTQLLHEAWTEGQTTPSAWGSPLWIPYLCMAAGMALLALQQALQAFKGSAK